MLGGSISPTSITTLEPSSSNQIVLDGSKAEMMQETCFGVMFGILKSVSLGTLPSTKFFNSFKSVSNCSLSVS